ncbi:MAG: CRTAC1 family protein [Bryobacterales bacterium]|nr:CRTAC1 family protein [Bryobacterales bacterium]
MHLYARLACLLAMLAALSFSLCAQIRLENVSAESGVPFVLDNAASERKHLIESVLGGMAAFDYDGDGRVDLFFTNGAEIPSLRKSSPKFWNRLYRNVGDFRFEDVTERAGLAGEGYSMGATAGDFDNDGHTDLFVAGVRSNRLYRNNGDGTFADVTAKAGIGSAYWSVAPAFLDFDNDGHLDLFVANYVEWTPDMDRYCGDRSRNLRVYCHPRYFRGTPNELYRNNGDGTFVNVSKLSGIGASTGKGMSVAAADVDTDGFVDVFVTNDSEPDFLFRNLGDGTFEEAGLLSGVAMSMNGRAISSMGADIRDYDNDGKPDIIVSALAGETFPLFRNTGGSTFADSTYASGLATASQRHSGWGVGLIDFDNDGWKDLITTNSHVNDRIAESEASSYHQPNTVFRNMEGKRFLQVADSGFEDALAAHHGAVFADFDGDGRTDVAVSVVNGTAEVWKNVTPAAGHWIALRLTGTRSNRSAIGARVEVDGQWNHVSGSVSYASSAPVPLLFGLGQAEIAKKVTVHWPSGTTQLLGNLAAGQMHEVKEPEK